MASPKPKPSRAERVVRSGRVAPLLLRHGDVELVKEVLATPEQIDRIKIDESYQRMELSSTVNELIAVLMSGACVPEPAVVSVRADGSWYAVEGQQRVWAHYECRLPMPVRLVRCKDHDVEQKLFLVLNNKHKVSAANTVKAWTGPSGELIHFLSESQESPLRGEITFNGSGPLPASTVAIALSHLIRGTKATPLNGTQHLLRQLDHSIEQDPGFAKKAATMFAVLLQRVFTSSRPYQLYVRALAAAAHEHWKSLTLDDAWDTPNGSQLRSLTGFRWDGVAPDFRSRWLPYLKDEILRRWPLRDAKEANKRRPRVASA